MSEHEHQSLLTDHEEATFCTVHPDRETGLRCNKCGRYMCAECAVLTPVGYRCRECVRQHEDRFFAGTTLDYVIVFATGAILTAVALGLMFLVGVLSWLLFVIILSIPLGGAVGETALRLTKRRRGRYSGYVGAAGVVAGGVVFMVLTGWILLPLNFWLNPALFIGIAAMTAYGRFRVSI